MKRWDPVPGWTSPPGFQSHPRTVRSTARVDDIEDIDALDEPHVTVVALRRHGHDALAAYAETLVRQGPAQVSTLASLNDPQGLDGVKAIAAALPPDDARDVLLNDIVCWLEVMTELSRAPHLMVRLIRLTSPVYHGFYVDPGVVRLVCTYVGAQSEWLDERDVDRGLLAGSGLVAPDAIRRGAVVERCELGDVVFFKGRGWPSAGAVHRAPDTTGPRLLLAIEPAWQSPA